MSTRPTSPAVLTWTIFVRIDLPVTKETSFTIAALGPLVFDFLLVFHHVSEEVVGVRSLSEFTLAHAARMEEVVAAAAFDQSRICFGGKAVAVLTLRWVVYGKGRGDPECFGVGAAFLLRCRVTGCW